MYKVVLKKYNQSHFSRGRSGIFILLWWFTQGTIFRFSLHNMYGFRRFILRCFGAKIGKGVKIRPSAKFTYPWKVTIGDYTWVGDNVEFYSLDKIIVGSNSVISQKTYLCTGSHDIEDSKFGLITKPIVIEDYVWIGADCFIGPGVNIKEGSVVGARSNVFKDVDSWGVYYGNPLRFIKKREIKK